MATNATPNRSTPHQISIRLTDKQLATLQAACLKVATSYGTPSVSKFLLTEGLATAERMLAKGQKG